MRTPEEELTRRLRRDASNRWIFAGFRSVISRGRITEANVNTTQLTVRNGGQLRVLAAEADGGPKGATSGDIGKLIFVPGYSEPGGDDFIPSE
ncbi:hypothetical protein [Caudoviricetes sp.]|nr:hypothetical protein [Caudoviricetes sp.]